MAWQGMAKCSRCGGNWCSCIENDWKFKEKQREANYQRSRDREYDVSIQKENNRVADIFNKIKEMISRKDLIKIAAHDINANVREAALLRLEEIK